MFIGPHVSTAGGVENAPARAKALGATGFGLFVKNQRQWRARAPSAEAVARFRAAMEENGYLPEGTLPHAGYLINLANPDDAKQAQSLDSLICEMRLCESYALPLLNLHPGSSLKLISTEAACDRIAEAINRAHAETSRVTVVLENTAGAGGTIGATFEELARIISGVKDASRVGVCIDTMHAFGAGYEVQTAEGWARTVAEFDRVVGLKWLRGMHLNDSMVPFASHRDRHQSLGKGEIGMGLFKTIAADSRFSKIPLVLETPDETLWPAEVAALLAAV